MRTVCPLACPRPAVSMQLWRNLPVHIAAGEEAGGGETPVYLPSSVFAFHLRPCTENRACLFCDARGGKKCPTHKLCNLKSGKKEFPFFFFPLYILRMTIGPLEQPGSMEGSQLRERKWKCSAMAEGGDWSGVFLPVHTHTQIQTS